ncbi:MAG: NADH-quinone oxidoreductase subunit [Thermoplasmata archaeon]|jgi:NADH-quinone oxidoreductase subunit D|nr:NADH-quinone oxidoreductase subunit [Thermoplasmata archaeon]
MARVDFANPMLPDGRKPTGQLMTLNMGPQHPSTHGVLRLKLLLDGEIVVDVEPVLGYLHRGSEKLAEGMHWVKFIPLTDRMDYLSAMHNNHGYVLAVEKLLGGPDQQIVSEKAEHIRVFAAEISRLCNHLFWMGTFMLDLGAISPLFYALRERETLLGFMEELCGARLTFNYFRFGGVKYDLPQDPTYLPRVKEFLAAMPKKVDQYETLLKRNDILLGRLTGTGPLSREQALEWGVTGPMLRATGVAHDLRKSAPYSVYKSLNFDVPTNTQSDCYGRLMNRWAEMRESVKILQQVITRLESGSLDGIHLNPDYAGGKILRVKAKGEAYARIEHPKGEYGCHVIGDGKQNPLRVHVRAPSFANLQVLPLMARGQKIADMVASLGSIDIVLGDVDR